MVLLTIVLAWLSNFLYERFSLSLTQAAFAATAYVQAGTALGLLCGSLLSDRLYRGSKQARFWMLSVAMVIAAPSVYLLVHSDTLAFAQCGAAGFGLANGVFASNVMVAPFDVIPPRARTAAIAAINTISTALAGLATLATGIWKDSFGIASMMSVFAAITLLCGALLFFFNALALRQRLPPACCMNRSQPIHDIRFLYDLKSPARDGVNLSTDVFLPRKGDSFPVIFLRTPYDSLRDVHIDWACWWARRGYAAAIQENRGRFKSHGTFLLVPR